MSTAPDVVLDRLTALHPKVIDLVLDRVHRLLEALDHPEARLPPVVHIAGTNGKGSTLAMLRAGLEGAGDTTHAYTSPHLARFNERIRVAGELIADDDLARLLAECEVANGGAPITFFEITTCAAILAFARTPADWTLLEVGLGGRLDATNVITPALTVITPVSMDHESYLGDTLAKIAGEKAGILKRGVPCVVGPQQEEALDVIEARAARIGAPLHVHGQHWHVTEEAGRLVFQDEDGLMDLPLPRLIGAHQVANAGAAIAALRLLGRADGADAAMTDVEWPARLQRLRSGPLVKAAGTAELWLDGGHNPAAGAALAEALTRLPDRPLQLDLRHAQHQGRDRLHEAPRNPSPPPPRRLHPRRGEHAHGRADRRRRDPRAPSGLGGRLRRQRHRHDHRRRPTRPHPHLRLALPCGPRPAGERMIRAALLLALATPAQAATHAFCWTGAAGYRVEGTITYPDGARGILTEEDVTGFAIEGWRDDTLLGRWSLDERTPDTTFILRFDAETLSFPMGGYESDGTYQAWNADGTATDCGDPGFGFNGGNRAQDVCVDGTFVEESGIAPGTPLAVSAGGTPCGPLPMSALTAQRRVG